MSAALKEGIPRLKVRHSRNSIGRLGEVRDALNMVHTVEGGADNLDLDPHHLPRGLA